MRLSSVSCMVPSIGVLAVFCLCVHGHCRSTSLGLLFVTGGILNPLSWLPPLLAPLSLENSLCPQWMLPYILGSSHVKTDGIGWLKGCHRGLEQANNCRKVGSSSSTSASKSFGVYSGRGWFQRQITPW